MMLSNMIFLPGYLATCTPAASKPLMFFFVFFRVDDFSSGVELELKSSWKNSMYCGQVATSARVTSNSM